MENMKKELEERELKELELMNENESREFYVYKHIRKDNNTCFYVGKGKGRRMYVPKRNKHFNRIRKKYGCYVVKIKENLTEKEAFALEREIIEDYVFVFGYGINIKGYYKGYNENERLTNCTWGGEGCSGYKFSEEQKQKMGELHKRENLSEETIQRMSESHKGMKRSEETKEKIRGEKNPMYRKNAYANKTPEEMEIIRKKKSEAVSGEKNPMFGKNPYANKTSEEMKIIGEKMSESRKGEKNGMWGKGKKVICTTTGEEFDSINQAATHYKVYKVSKSTIIRCCKGKQKSAGELNGVRLQWKYSEDDDNESKAV